jgi:hypothetical protein|tara:strand:- start:130 stop:1017 length:888 start_codon:yes stop_codon:yes gene_type:complete
VSDKKAFAILVTTVLVTGRLPAIDCPADSASFVDLNTTSASYGENVNTGLCACLDFGATLSGTDSSVTLSILMYENEPLRGFQFEIADNSGDALVLRSVTAGDEISSWTVLARETSTGSVIVFGFSPEGEETVAQSEGILLEVTFDIVGGLGGEVSFYLDDDASILLSDVDAENVVCSFPTFAQPATYPVDWLAVGSDDVALPTQFALMQNYPNPFNPETTIAFHLKEKVYVDMAIFDLLGRRVTTVVNRVMPAGFHDARWNGKDSAGNEIASGIYIANLRAGEFIDQNKMVLLR